MDIAIINKQEIPYDLCVVRKGMVDESKYALIGKGVIKSSKTGQTGWFYKEKE